MPLARVSGLSSGIACVPGILPFVDRPFEKSAQGEVLSATDQPTNARG